MELKIFRFPIGLVLVQSVLILCPEKSAYRAFNENDGIEVAWNQIESLSLTFHGHDLIVDSELKLNYGRRYGLLGLNAYGESTLLTAIGCRKCHIPEHMDIFHLTREIEASDMSSLEDIINCDKERLKLEKEAELLAEQDDGSGEALGHIYEHLDAMDAFTAEKYAVEILFGLSYTKQMQEKRTTDFSGGWRKKIALARALFMNPIVLLLDKPRNHLGVRGPLRKFWAAFGELCCTWGQVNPEKYVDTDIFYLLRCSGHCRVSA